MELSKAFDCVRHDLLIANLHVYGFSHGALMLVHSYLENRQQRVKTNGTFTSYKHRELGVPQGSLTGDVTIQNSQEQKIMWVLIGTNLSFEKNINNLCRKTCNKLFTLLRMSENLGSGHYL